MGKQFDKMQRRDEFHRLCISYQVSMIAHELVPQTICISYQVFNVLSCYPCVVQV